jgi:hypothetical protein
MEDTGDDSEDPEEPHEWSSEKVATFVRELGAPQCFQSTGDDQVLHLGVDGSVFFDLSLNDSEDRKKSEKDTDPKDKDQE